MREVGPLYGVDPALVLTNPCTQDRPCVVNEYIRQEVGVFQQNKADLEE